MKVLVVLVLAVFTGCNANLFYADEPRSKLDEWTDAFWGYADKAWQTADDTLDKIRQTKIGQNVEASLTEGVRVTSTYAETALDQVPQPVGDAIDRAMMLVYGMSKQAEQGMSDLKKKIEPFVEPVAEKVHSVLTQGAEQVIEMASPYVDKIKEKLDPMAKDVQTRLTNLLESFEKTN